MILAMRSRLRHDDYFDGALRFRPAKQSNSTVWRQCSPFVDIWMRFLHLSVSANQPLFHIGNALQCMRHLAGSEFTWHSMRRGGAATLLHLGAHPSQLLHWGRWRSQQALEPYLEERSPFHPPATVQLFGPDGTPTHHRNRSFMASIPLCFRHYFQ